MCSSSSHIIEDSWTVWTSYSLISLKAPCTSNGVMRLCKDVLLRYRRCACVSLAGQHSHFNALRSPERVASSSTQLFQLQNNRIASSLPWEYALASQTCQVCTGQIWESKFVSSVLRNCCFRMKQSIFFTL